MRQRGQLFVVSAPSGAGKTTLCKALIARLAQEGERELFWSVSYTTRPARNGETHGRDYFFVDDATFDRMIAEGVLAEWAVVHGKRYGTSQSYLEDMARQGHDLLIEIDVQGARQLRSKQQAGHYIFVLPPTWEVLEARLRGRGTEPESEVRRRLTRAREETLEWTGFDYIIINDDFARALDRLWAVVMAARASREAMRDRVRSILSLEEVEAQWRE
jgi:guanylate kinase